MIRVLRVARGKLRTEGGFTLVELMVAAAMSVVVVGAASSMLISAVKSQPELTKRAQSVSNARWVLARLTREIRNGVVVDKATPSSVSFRTYVRSSTCGSGATSAAGTAAIKCEVTYTCSTTACTRIEAAENVFAGTATTIFTGISNSSVFCYVPSTEASPLTCGPAATASGTKYIGVKLQIPSPNGKSSFIVSDGASMRNATLSN
jgi:Tfp pilus assembly protein PilW